MRIGIFGGSFNPIHKGHTALAQSVVDAGWVDSVWLMVTPQNPLRPTDELLDEHLRLHLVRLAVCEIPCLEASDFEFHLPRPSYTHLTLRRLTDTFPSHTFTLIIGDDNWELFPRWRHADDILRSHPVVVYPRSHAPLPTKDDRYPNVHFMTTAPRFPVSSTEIRQRIARGDDPSPWLDASVAAEIKRLQLYQPPSD
jgi:nicotinate-nucleotide adenylyltransferase